MASSVSFVYYSHGFPIRNLLHCPSTLDLDLHHPVGPNSREKCREMGVGCSAKTGASKTETYMGGKGQRSEH